MMRNSVSKLTNGGKVIINLFLVQSMCFGWKNLQKGLTTHTIISFSKQMCPKAKMKRSYHFIMAIFPFIRIRGLQLVYICRIMFQ